MSKTQKLTSLLCAGLIASSTFMPLASVAAAQEFSNGMDIDVNYDPFKDGPKDVENQQEKTNVDESSLPFKERMALKAQREGRLTEVTIATTSVVPGHIYIPKRTALEVELVDRIECKKAKKYQSVDFRLKENLIINGVIVIPAGTIGEGYVYEVQKPGAFGRKGVLRIAANHIKTINGIKVPLMKGLEGKGKTDGGAVAVAVVVSLVGGFFMRGAGITYEPGTNFTVEVRNDTDLQCTPEGLAAAMDPSKPRGQYIQVMSK